MPDKCPSPEHLSQYLEDELTGDEAEEVRKHLETCSGCTVLARKMTGLVANLQTLPQIPISADFTEKVMVRTRKEKVGKSPMSGFTFLITIVLSGAILALTGFLSSRGSGDPGMLTPLFEGMFSFFRTPAGNESASILLRGIGGMGSGIALFLFVDVLVLAGLSKFLWNRQLPVNLESRNPA